MESMKGRENAYKILVLQMVKLNKLVEMFFLRFTPTPIVLFKGHDDDDTFASC
jgi:hypothetical protein